MCGGINSPSYFYISTVTSLIVKHFLLFEENIGLKDGQSNIFPGGEFDNPMD